MRTTAVTGPTPPHRSGTRRSRACALDGGERGRRPRQPQLPPFFFLAQPRMRRRASAGGGGGQVRFPLIRVSNLPLAAARLRPQQRRGIPSSAAPSAGKGGRLRAPAAPRRTSPAPLLTRSLASPRRPRALPPLRRRFLPLRSSSSRTRQYGAHWHRPGSEMRQRLDPFQGNAAAPRRHL